PWIVRDAPITGARTFYTDANKSGKKMGPKDNTFIRLIQRQDAEDTTMGPVWIPSARKISTWTTDMAP
ncbi:hypothetical protein LEMLEM_LOCUS6685, partial [Lemmus lemmus]